MKYFFYISLLLIISCKSQKTQDIEHTQNPVFSEPHIVFLLLKAKKIKEKISIETMQNKLVKGKLKGIFSPIISTENLKDKNWLVSFQDHSKTGIIQLQITNPLVEEIEFINDNNELEKRVIYHKEKEFVIRIPYDNSINSITFESLKKENKNIIKNNIEQIDFKLKKS